MNYAYKSVEVLVRESAERLRRLETRVTKFMEAQGFDTQVRRPIFHDDGTLEIPSASVSLKDCLEAVPTSWDPEAEIVIKHKGKHLLAVFLNVD